MLVIQVGHEACARRLSTFDGDEIAPRPQLARLTLRRATIILPETETSVSRGSTSWMSSSSKSNRGMRRLLTLAEAHVTPLVSSAERADLEPHLLDDE